MFNLLTGLERKENWTEQKGKSKVSVKLRMTEFFRVQLLFMFPLDFWSVLVFFLNVVNAYPRPDWALLINIEPRMTDVQLSCRLSLGPLSTYDKTLILYYILK